MTGSGLSTASQSFIDTASDRQSTPSTDANSSSGFTPEKRVQLTGDSNQWIRRPTGLGIYGQQLLDLPQDDPISFFKKLGHREIGILSDYMRLWTRSISELLENIKATIPSEGMIGEVHYWRDLARVLDAINQECKQPFVEVVVQVMLNSDEISIKKDIEAFSR